MRETALRILAVALLQVAVGCSSSTGTTEQAADQRIKVCAAGLSTSTSARIEAATAGVGVSIGGAVLREVKGFIFQDPTINSADRVVIYEKYLGCIRDRGVQIEVDDADETVQTVQSTNDYSAASGLSRYDWVSEYNRRYKNIGDRTVECRLRVRGVLLNRSSRSVRKVGEVKTHQFVVRPGATQHIEGKVGIEGFNTDSLVVSTDDTLECWYR